MTSKHLKIEQTFSGYLLIVKQLAAVFRYV